MWGKCMGKWQRGRAHHGPGHAQHVSHFSAPRTHAKCLEPMPMHVPLIMVVRFP